MTDKTELEVSQRARDAAAVLLAGMNEGICEGRRDSLSVVQAFARFERDILTTRTPDPTPVAWMPIESAPMDELILAAIKVHNNRTGASWWERHIIVIDSETGTISDMDYYHGWEADDYEGWQHLPPAPGDMLATHAVPDDGLVEALERIAAPAIVSLDQCPDADQPNGWRHLAVDRIDIARNALAAYRGEA